MNRTKLTFGNEKMVQSGATTMSLSGVTEFRGFKRIRIRDGNEAVGKILTSDANGYGVWGDGNLSALKVYYVDSNNTVDGDGSVINPFRTLDLAHTAIVGGGSIAAPDKEGITVFVQGGTYNTAKNLAVKSTTWSFEDGSVVNYTGTSYLINTSGLSNVSQSIVKVLGSGDFRTSTGGLIYAEGTTSTSANGIYRLLTMEAYKLTSTYNNSVNPLLKPMIYITNSGSGRNAQWYNLFLDLKDDANSMTQTTLYVDNKSRYKITGVGANARLSYSVSTATASALGHVINLRNAYTSEIFNINIWGIYCQNMVQIGYSGGLSKFARIIFNNIEIDSTTTASIPQRFMRIYDIDFDSAFYNELLFIIEKAYHSSIRFSDTTKFIEFAGSATTFNYLQLNNSFFPFPIDSKIKPGKFITNGADITKNYGVSNTFGDKFNISDKMSLYYDNTNTFIDGNQGALNIRNSCGSCVSLFYGTAEKVKTLTNGFCACGCGFATDFVASSDERIKENVYPIDDPIELTMGLCGVRYNRKDEEDKKTHYGFIAQEVEKVIPEIVTETPLDPSHDSFYMNELNMETMKAIKYEKVIPILVEAFKKQRQEILELKNEIEQLKNK